jgi:predicted  nucleic acid-binding Zn-ribbon protein
VTGGDVSASSIAGSISELDGCREGGIARKSKKAASDSRRGESSITINRHRASQNSISDSIQPRLSLEWTPFKQKGNHVVETQGNYAVHELKIKLNDEQDLNKSLEGQLQAAEDHIADLEQKLKDAGSTLTGAILQDRDDQIRKQQHVIENLTEQLGKVEDKRNHLRKQFQESELKVWQLEREIGRLEHRDAGC